MANWRRITEADVKTRISGKELAAFRNAALGLGEGSFGADSDPIELVIDAVSDRVRGAVAQYPRNELGAAGQVPKVLIDAALALIVMRVMSRAFGEILDPSGQRKDDATAAELLLDKVSKGEGVAIPGLAEDDDEGESGAVPAVPIEYERDHCETFDRSDQDGI